MIDQMHQRVLHKRQTLCVSVFLLCVCVCSAEREKLSVVGSPFWMAPEVLRDELYNEKVKTSDL